MGWISTRRNYGLSPLISVLDDLVVAAPTVRVDHCARLYSTSYEGGQIGRSTACNLLHADTSEALRGVDFNSDSNDCFRSGVSSESPVLLATDIGFIDLNDAAQAIPFRSNHGPPELVQPRPSRLITAQSQDTLQAQRTRAILLTGQIPHGTKPSNERQTGVLKDRAGGNGNLTPASCAQPKTTRHRPPFWITALRANESLWPPQRSQIAPTCLLRGEAPLQLGQRPRVVFHGIEPAAKSG
jgi:hypothetical protein